jgi:hypothetical protein
MLSITGSFYPNIVKFFLYNAVGAHVKDRFILDQRIYSHSTHDTTEYLQHVAIS